MLLQGSLDILPLYLTSQNCMNLSVPIFVPHLFLFSMMVIILTLTAANSVEARPGLYHLQRKEDFYINGTFRHRGIAGRQLENQREETCITDSLERDLLWEKKPRKTLGRNTFANCSLVSLLRRDQTLRKLSKINHIKLITFTPPR